MTLQEAKEELYDASGTLSENVRKLAFAGIAVIWIFKVGEPSATQIALPAALLLALRAFVIALLLDVAQYLWKSTVWWLYYRFKHKRNVADTAQVDPPGVFNFITGVFFYSKVASVAYGYVVVFGFISGLIKTTGSR